MQNEERIIELLAESLKRQDQMVEKLTAMENQLVDSNNTQKQMLKRLDNLEKQQAKTNLEVSEIRLSAMRIAEAIEKMANHEDRIKALEKAVFK